MNFNATLVKYGNGHFAKKHGIRKLFFKGEKLSADQFVPRFRRLVEEKSLTHN